MSENVFNSFEIGAEFGGGAILFLFKGPVEVGNVVESAFIAYFRNTFVCFNQHSCGAPQADFI